MLYTFLLRHWPSRLRLVSLFAVLLYFTIIHKASAGCRIDNTSDMECSGRGICFHGECKCNERANPEEMISGSFCECDNFSCERLNGLLCSGPDHGICACGRCQCHSGWIGPACECQQSYDKCITPTGIGAVGEVCSGKGICECGVCKCFIEEEVHYSGKYCERCPTCPSRCQELLECVKCQVYKTGILTEEECTVNCTFVPTKVDMVEANEERDERICIFYDEDDCRFAFVYGYDETGKVYVRAQKEKECFLNLHF